MPGNSAAIGWREGLCIALTIQVSEGFLGLLVFGYLLADVRL